MMEAGDDIIGTAVSNDRRYRSLIGSRFSLRASSLNLGRYVVSTRCRRSVSAFSSACSSVKIGSALPIGLP